jgi:hypothetical protein
MNSKALQVGSSASPFLYIYTYMYMLTLVEIIWVLSLGSGPQRSYSFIEDVSRVCMPVPRESLYFYACSVSKVAQW